MCVCVSGGAQRLGAGSRGRQPVGTFLSACVSGRIRFPKARAPRPHLPPLAPLLRTRVRSPVTGATSSRGTPRGASPAPTCDHGGSPGPFRNRPDPRGCCTGYGGREAGGGRERGAGRERGGAGSRVPVRGAGRGPPRGSGGHRPELAERGSEAGPRTGGAVPWRALGPRKNLEWRSWMGVDRREFGGSRARSGGAGRWGAQGACCRAGQDLRVLAWQTVGHGLANMEGVDQASGWSNRMGRHPDPSQGHGESRARPAGLGGGAWGSPEGGWSAGAPRDLRRVQRRRTERGPGCARACSG